MVNFAKAHDIGVAEAQELIQTLASKGLLLQDVYRLEADPRLQREVVELIRGRLGTPKAEYEPITQLGFLLGTPEFLGARGVRSLSDLTKHLGPWRQVPAFQSIPEEVWTEIALVMRRHNVRIPDGCL